MLAGWCSPAGVLHMKDETPHTIPSPRAIAGSRTPATIYDVGPQGYDVSNSRKWDANPTPPNPGADHRPGHVYDEKSLPLQAIP